MARNPITTVLARASSYDLTDLATAKSELGIAEGSTDYDAWIGRAISQVSVAVKNDCNRTFNVEMLQDSFLGVFRPFAVSPAPEASAIQLARWPIIDVVSVVQTPMGQSSVTLVAGTDFTINADNGWLIRLDANGGEDMWEFYPLVVTYVAGFGDATIENFTVPATPYQVTVSKAAVFGCDIGVAYANGTALTKTTGTPTVGKYAVNVSTGVYTFAAADLAASVNITYAYDDIPADILEATLRTITMRFKTWKRDPMLVSQSNPQTGDQRFWVGSVPGQNSPFPPEIACMLDNYRVPVIA